MQRIKNIRKFLVIVSLLFAIIACSEDDSFTVSPTKLLSFSKDTISMDTVFSRVPTATKTFWIYNRSGSGIRSSSVRLEKGSQTGFRANVDGIELSRSQGFIIGDIEIPKGDSVRVFVELTSLNANQEEPKLIEDDLVFLLESGVEQRVHLDAWTWDAEILRNVIVSNDSVISADKPIIIHGGITIKQGATLTVSRGTTLYFHDGAGIEVYGRLRCEGTAEENVVFRGDRLDRMFDYLPYDGVSGQWKGIHFYESSYDNSIDFTDIHSACDAIVCDSSDVSKLKLTLTNSIVHNNQGYGMKLIHSVVDVENCQITNTLNDCVAVFGGVARLNNCTIAQFYPFDSNRGAALRFTNYFGESSLPLYDFKCINTIVTGYSDDVIMGEVKDEAVSYAYFFDHCLLRTPEITDDSEHFVDIIWENTEDTITSGEKNFIQVDHQLQRYNFQLSSKSLAIGAANKMNFAPSDRLGRLRDDLPDMGCYEIMEESKEEE